MNNKRCILEKVSSWKILLILLGLLICKYVIFSFLCSSPSLRIELKSFSLKHPVVESATMIIEYAFIAVLWLKLFLFLEKVKSQNRMAYIFSLLLCAFVGIGFVLFLMLSRVGLLQAMIIDAFVCFNLVNIMKRCGKPLLWTFWILFFGMAVYVFFRIGQHNHPQFLTSLFTDFIEFRTLWSWDNLLYLWTVRFSLVFLYATCVFSILCGICRLAWPKTFQ